MHPFSFGHTKEEFVVTAPKLSALLVYTKQEYDKHRRANGNNNQPSVWFHDLPTPLQFLSSQELLFKSIFHSGPPVPQPETFHRRFVEVEISYRCRGSLGNKSAAPSDTHVQQQHMMLQQSSMLMQLMQGMVQNGQQSSMPINIIGQPRGPRRSGTWRIGDDLEHSEARRPLMLTLGDSETVDLLSPGPGDVSPGHPRMLQLPPKQSEVSVVAVPLPLAALPQAVAPAVAPAVPPAGGDGPDAGHVLDAILERNRAKSKSVGAQKAKVAAGMLQPILDGALSDPPPKAAAVNPNMAGESELAPPPKKSAAPQPPKCTLRSASAKQTGPQPKKAAPREPQEPQNAMPESSACAKLASPPPKKAAPREPQILPQEAPVGLVLGCSKCRGSRAGCSQCRNPLWNGKRFTRA